MVTRFRKLFFWIILGAMSVLFAEVIAGSSPFPFFSIFGLLMVFPLYFLHTLFFFYIVYNYGKPALAPLYIAGTIFGMYEAYLTKVIWVSYLDTGPIIDVGGIAIIETLLLVLVWHSILAFAVPLFIGETYLTKSKEMVGLFPEFVRKHGKVLFIVFIVFGGIFTSGNSPSVSHSLLSTLSSGAVVLVLIYLWRKIGGDKHSIRELLPSKKAFRVIVALFILMYIVYTRLLNWDKLPGFEPQAIVWLIYVLLIWLLVRNIKKSKTQKTVDVDIEGFSMKKAFYYLSLFVLSAVLGELFINPAIVWISTFVLILFPGIYLFYYSVKKAFV